MRYLIYGFLLALTTISCKDILKQSPDENALLTEEISKINWEQVDEPAGLVLCDSLGSEQEKMACLQETLRNKLQEKFSNQTIKTVDLNVDSIWVKFTINSDSTITIEPDVSEITNYETQQNISQLIVTNFEELPTAYPAIKRGIPVKTQINVPITFIK